MLTVGLSKQKIKSLPYIRVVLAYIERVVGLLENRTQAIEVVFLYVRKKAEIFNCQSTIKKINE